MTISLAWVRRNQNALELIIASDSRLRSRGPLDQAQKIMRLERGDCALSFCGDAQVAYPLFMQVGSTLNNFIKTRSRATDVTELTNTVGSVLNALIGSWDLPDKDKADELRGTYIVLSGWSWRLRQFRFGLFGYKEGRFKYARARTKLLHPRYQNTSSLLFVGDYKQAYLEELSRVLSERHGTAEGREDRKIIDLQYEPLLALRNLLKQSSVSGALPAIGGAPQMLKIYPFSQTLPFVVRLENDAHYLFGRQLFNWEKTEYPVADMTDTELKFLYPMSEIPLPAALQDRMDSMAAEPEPALPSP